MVQIEHHLLCLLQQPELRIPALGRELACLQYLEPTFQRIEGDPQSALLEILVDDGHSPHDRIEGGKALLAIHD